MSEESKDHGGIVKYGVSVEDAVVVVNVEAKVDVVKVLENLAEKSENTIDDKLVKLVALARDNADWEGYAKEHLF